MLCNHCGSNNQNPNSNCTNCGALNIQMSQNAVLPPLPTVRATWQQQCGQQQVATTNVVSCRTPWWAWLLIVLASLGLVAGATLGIIALAKGATTAEMIAATSATDKKIDTAEKNLGVKIDDVGKKVDTLDKNVGTVLTAIDKKIDSVDTNVKMVNTNVGTLDENLAQAKKDLSKEITDDGDKTRKTVGDEVRKVRWSIQRSERKFEAISDKLDRIERVKPTVNVKIVETK